MSLRGARLFKGLVLACLALGSAAAWAQGASPTVLTPPPLVQVEDGPAPGMPTDDAASVAPIPPQTRAGRDPTDPGALALPGLRGEAAPPRLGGAAPSAVTLTLRDAGLPPPPSAALRALRSELASLPAELEPSGATWFGHVLTDVALSGLFLGGVGFFGAFNELEQGFYLLVAASSAVMLPIGALTWAVGEIVDGHRRKALKRRRDRLLMEIDREMAFDPRW